MKNFHIMLADDDKDDRFFFKTALARLDPSIRLTTVEDGQKLLESLKANTALPDVLFLDLNMPRMNGSECLLEIKANKKISSIPIVIYSTSLHEEVADVLYRNGAHFYLKKCDIADLPKAISQVLKLLQKNPRQPTRNKFIVNLQLV